MRTEHTLTPSAIAYLLKFATEISICEVSTGTSQEAYDVGFNDGRIDMARDILDSLGIDYFGN